MSDFQQELSACRESAERGYKFADESFQNLKSALEEAKTKLREADSQQNQLWRLENDSHFQNQFREMRKLERQTVSRVGDNLSALKKKLADFTIVLYGRTMAGKSTLMEILRHGNGESIGKGAQRTTLDVRAYEWNGLKIFDVPGTCSFGGAVDDKTALEAAKSADLALFLLTDDAPQPYEAERLAELKALGKPVLGIVNVKQALSPDRQAAKRKLDVKQIQKRINDPTRLEEIVRQFKEFAKKGNNKNFKGGYNFDDVPFVYSHLQSAFFSQRENDSSLYELSNFKAVENFILDKISSDGQFIRTKTFIDAVALPVQNSIAALYGQSAETIKAWEMYLDKVTQLNDWYENFFESVKSRLSNFMDGLTSDINGKLDYVVNNYYDSNKAGEEWKNSLDDLDITRRCQNFIQRIGAEATEKMRELSDELTQDLSYAGVSVDANISMSEINDVQGGLMLAAPLLMFTPVGWVGAAFLGLGAWLFGDSKEEKIRKAKNELREKLEESRDDLLGKTWDSLTDVINNEILGKQIRGFKDTLFDMMNMLEKLAYTQNHVADTINSQYFDLNGQLLWDAIQYSGDDPRKLEKLELARVVGNKFLVFSTTASKISDSTRRKISSLIGENVEFYEIDEENYFGDEMKIIEEKILKSEFGFSKFVEDEENGDMYVITLPRENYYTPEQIQLAQQLTYDPVVSY